MSVYSAPTGSTDIDYYTMAQCSPNPGDQDLGEQGNMQSIDHGTVLVLNASYSPMNIIPWTDAIGMIWLGKAIIVKESEIPCRSQYMEWRRPLVIALKKYIRARDGDGTVKYSKRALLERDNYRCQYRHRHNSGYAHEGKLTADHVVPICKGGRTEWTNMVACCERCQMIKGGKLLKDTPLVLVRKPAVFKVQGLEERLQSRLKRIVRLPDEWTDYIWSR